MAKVYAIWTGQYSDASVRGIFDTRQKAEDVIAQMKACREHEASISGGAVAYGWDDPHIEEYELNVDNPILHPYECAMDSDGRVRWIAIGSELHFCADPRVKSFANDPQQLWFACGATKELAIKNCGDFRRVWLASH